ncbi:hypothetical protein PU560_11275 [Georgenia sp. 10Sc9-8]|uniref:Uncharacterized protein n=1 Tax=Georgenia halotolerans TaxID=3028317 RepID=A0ABT5TZE5_9MICO|nr:hypothetical protein [Georgenia halotolerans]
METFLAHEHEEHSAWDTDRDRSRVSRDPATYLQLLGQVSLLPGAPLGDTPAEVRRTTAPAAWAAGKHSIMVAVTGEDVTTLAAQARRDLIAAGRVQPGGVSLHDGTTAGRGTSSSPAATTGT